MEFGRVFILKCFLPRAIPSFFPAGCGGACVGWSFPPQESMGGVDLASRSPPSMLRFCGFGGFWKKASVFAGNDPTELKFYRCFNQGQTLMSAGYASSGSGFQKKPSANQGHLGNTRESKALVCAWGNVRRSSRKDSDPGWTQDP